MSKKAKPLNVSKEINQQNKEAVKGVRDVAKRAGKIAKQTIKNDARTSLPDKRD